MFQFRRFPTYAYLIQRTLLEVCSSGFPHSEISGSMLICSSPKLIAACHVLHRLLMPRHSPCALYSLTSSKQAPYRSPRRKRQVSFTSLLLLSNLHPLRWAANSEIFWFSLRIMQAPLRIVTFWLNCIFTLKNNCFLTVAYS